MGDFVDWMQSLSLLQVYGIGIVVSFITALTTMAVQEGEHLGKLVEETGASPILLTLVLMAAGAVMSVLWPVTLVYTIVTSIRRVVIK